MLNKLANEIYQNAKDKGFYDKPETRDQYIERACNNLHDEVSELHTAWRDNMLDTYCDKAGGMVALGLEPLTFLEEELADIIIRTLDNMKHLGIDPEHVITIKHKYNQTREYRHGNKRS